MRLFDTYLSRNTNPPKLGRLKEYERYKEQYANRPDEGITKTWARPKETLGTPPK
jgi:hypothetical protein